MHRQILYMAGQLGLDPPTMLLTSGRAGVQSHLTKYSSACRPLYSDTVGPMFNGIIEAPGPMKEIAVDNVEAISEGVDMKLGNMFDVSETSMYLPSNQPNMEPNLCFRYMTL